LGGRGGKEGKGGHTISQVFTQTADMAKLFGGKPAYGLGGPDSLPNARFGNGMEWNGCWKLSRGVRNQGSWRCQHHIYNGKEEDDAAVPEHKVE